MIPIVPHEFSQGFKPAPVTNGGKPKGKKADKAKRKAAKQARKTQRRKK